MAKKKSVKKGLDWYNVTVRVKAKPGVTTVKDLRAAYRQGGGIIDLGNYNDLGDDVRTGVVTVTRG